MESYSGQLQICTKLKDENIHLKTAVKTARGFCNNNNNNNEFIKLINM